MRAAGNHTATTCELRSAGGSLSQGTARAKGFVLTVCAATLVASAWLALGSTGETYADTLVLRKTNLTLEGRVVSESRDVVQFALPLFRYVSADRRRHEDVQWRAEVLRVPRSHIAELTRSEAPLPRSRPTGEDSVEERLDAASAFLAAGRDQVLDTARQLYREVLDELGEFDGDGDGDSDGDGDGDRDGEAGQEDALDEEQRESLRRAAEGMLRFRILDILSAWRDADEAQRDELLAELERYQAGHRVVFELVTLRALDVTWRLKRESRTRERVIEQLQEALVEEREALRTFVTEAAEAYARAEHGWGEERMQAYLDELAKRMRILEALVEHPGALEALAATRRYGRWVQELTLLEELAPRAFGEEVGERLHVRIAQDTGVWRARIRAEHVVDVVDGKADSTGAVLREDNEVLREANEALLEGADDAVRDTFLAINDYRALLGLRRLEVSPLLMRAAQRSAQRFLSRRELDHNLGGTPLQRARREGFAGPHVGENLYRSEKREAAASEVLAAWQHSPEHHANLIRKDFRAVGLGQARYYWCLMLGDGR